MKIMENRTASSPSRARIYLAGKGQAGLFEAVDTKAGPLETSEFPHRDRMQRVPVLVLGGGTRVAQSTAIRRCFEEIQPEPGPFAPRAFGRKSCADVFRR